MIIKSEYFTMSDGVKLYTQILLPEENKKLPIIFMRTPYATPLNGAPCPPEQFLKNNFFKIALENGYAILYQHVRGHGDSEGDCVPYIERQDGLDSLEIIRKLPFYNGEIYLRGGSYGATVHLCYLETNPSDVKAASLDIQTDRVYYKNYRNGCCYDFCNAKWWAYMLKNRYPKHLSDTKSIVYADILKRPYEKIMERLVGEDVPEYTDMLLNETYNDFWINGENTYAADNLKIPTLFGEGWYDFYVDGMFSMWERLPEETRKKSAFLVGPWGHGTCRTDATEHPLPNSQIPVDYIIAFFNSIRDNTPYTQFELGKTNYYSIGGGRWTTQTEEKGKFKLYFNGDNTMSAKPTCTGEMHYIYDPEKPLGYYKRLNIFKQGEPVDGVVSFTSAPFEEDISFFGKIAWHMKVRSSCDDTAFFMRVYMVEDGESYNLTDTITSLSYLNENYAAGEACLIDIVTPQIGFTIKKGNAIRVDISSHSDIYVPHANVKGHWAKATETKVATNTLICDEDAYIELSVCLD